jgi:hypothetical protein
MSKGRQREVTRAIVGLYMEMLWRNRRALVVACVSAIFIFYLFIVMPGVVELPEYMTPFWDRMDGPTTTEVGTVVSLDGWKLKLMRVEYADVSVTLLAPTSARVGDAVDVTHSVKHPERVLSARMRAQ